MPLHHRFVGVDVGASALHAVAIEGRRIVDALVVAPGELDRLVAFCIGTGGVAIDAPSEPSTAPHADDIALSPKFRGARCGEVALQRQARISVAWVTPAAGAEPPWMAAGYALWSALRSAGHEPIEVYPAGAFRTLAGAAVPNKQTVAGAAARWRLLDPFVDRPLGADVWGHDGVDALAAAVVAMLAAEGRAVRHGCDHDGSAIWLPQPVL